MIKERFIFIGTGTLVHFGKTPKNAKALHYHFHIVGQRLGWSTNANHQKYREADGLGR